MGSGEFRSQSITTYRCHTVGDGYTGQTVTIVKCMITYRSNTFGDGYTGQTVTLGKCMVSLLCCVSRVIHRYMRCVEIAGMTGRGYRNLYRPVTYRTAGGSCVCSRKIEYGGITLKNHLQKEVVLL